MSTRYDCDVAIIGAGVAGALVANALAEDLSVMLLEAGPRIERGEAFGRFLEAPIKTPQAPYLGAPLYPFPRSEAPDDWYVQAGPQRFDATYVKGVGGTTWHWLGTCLRFVPDDFRLRSKFGRGLDWPLDYAALEPWYGKAEAALGVAGPTGEDPLSPRSSPYPLPEIPTSYLDRKLAEALAGTAYADVRPTPQARNSIPYRDRPACCGSASCIPLCPIGAKYDAALHCEAAEAKGARLLDGAVVVGLDTGAEGRITKARIRLAAGGEANVQAKVFVLAAHAIESPRLLLNSASAAYPSGLANSSDQVGRNLMDHPVQLSWALGKEPLYPWRGPLSTAGIESPRAGDFRADHPAFRIEILNGGWSWPTGAPESTARSLIAKGLRGEALDRALRDRTARQIALSSLMEQLPNPDNRIDLDPSLTDHYGVPRPRIHYALDDYTRAGLTAAKQAHREVFQRLGVEEEQHASDIESAQHIIGTLRMGQDPNLSVVDTDLKAHQHRNLFVLGSAVFPTSAVANPTLTIAALALRAVEPIRRSALA